MSAHPTSLLGAIIIDRPCHVERAVTCASGYGPSYIDTGYSAVSVVCEPWLDHEDPDASEVIWISGADRLTDEEREEAEEAAIVDAWAIVNAAQPEKLVAVRPRLAHPAELLDRMAAIVGGSL